MDDGVIIQGSANELHPEGKDPELAAAALWKHITNADTPAPKELVRYGVMPKFQALHERR